MSQRKCIYTGLPAKAMDKVIPKKGGDESHNWVNTVPCSDEYKKIKGRREPNDLEMEANRLFRLLENAKLDVEFYTEKLESLQAKIRKNNNLSLEDAVEKKKNRLNKEQQVEVAYKEKEISEMPIEDVVEESKKKMVW